jgi:hypothetical protein
VPVRGVPGPPSLGAVVWLGTGLSGSAGAVPSPFRLDAAAGSGI